MQRITLRHAHRELYFAFLKGKQLLNTQSYRTFFIRQKTKET